MFEETIKSEILKHEKRMAECTAGVQQIAEEIAREQNLSGTLIEKSYNYEREVKVLQEYRTLLYKALSQYKDEDFKEDIELIKNSALTRDKACQKIMDGIYAKYPESDKRDFDEMAKSDLELANQSLKDIEELQKVIEKQEEAKARYRMCLLILKLLS